MGDRCQGTGLVLQPTDLSQEPRDPRIGSRLGALDLSLEVHDLAIGLDIPVRQDVPQRCLRHMIRLHLNIKPDLVLRSRRPRRNMRPVLKVETDPLLREKARDQRGISP